MTGGSETRATSPVVGVVVLVGLTVTLAAVGGALLAFGSTLEEPPPRATFEASLDATDGWPDGQRLRVAHAGGEPVPVDELALVVTLDRPNTHTRLTGFPTRRLTSENLHGRDVVDNGYAGVDGTLDAAHTDGRWASGESAWIRIAQGAVDVRPGDRAVVTVVHRPTNAVLSRMEVTAARERPSAAHEGLRSPDSGLSARTRSRSKGRERGREGVRWYGKP